MPTPPDQRSLLDQRRKHLGRGLSLSYAEPLTIVRGRGAYLYDADGRAYLDCVNNVCHVGHCHPRVVAAASEQMARLNTNTRYLYPELTDYLAALTAKFPEPLSVVYLVCSGSEAVDLALRLARTATGARDVIALEAAYHGHTEAVIDVSAYKFDGPGGAGAPPSTHLAPLPCTYRGRHRRDDPHAGAAYAGHVERIVASLAAEGRRPAAFLSESILGVGGQILLPEGFLRQAYAAVRAAGGVCIADEVQVGFGRVGSCYWAFELSGVVPDVVTLGKPIGNGHPMAAVVTTPEISAAFDNGMEYFNTFGGNPVSCAVGLEVLRVVDEEGLQAHAREVGGFLLEELRSRLGRHALVGDVRGSGLFLGVELVRDRTTLEPAAEEAAAVVEELRRRSVLLSVDGPLHNVLKIKPPMVFSMEDAGRLVDELDRALDRAGPTFRGPVV